MGKNDVVEEIIKKTLDVSGRMMAVMPYMAEPYRDISSELEFAEAFLVRSEPCVFEAEKDIVLYYFSTREEDYHLVFAVIDAGTEFEFRMWYYGVAYIEGMRLPMSSPSILQLKYCRQKSLDCLIGVDRRNLEEPFLKQIARSYGREKIVKLVDSYSNTYRTEDIFPEARKMTKDELIDALNEKELLRYDYGRKVYEKYIANNMPEKRRHIFLSSENGNKISTSYYRILKRVELYYSRELESSRDFDRYVSALNFIPVDIVHILELLE